jgi:hypothetical protein
MTTNLLLFKYILAGFTSPVYIGSTAKALLWALPLLAVISIVYKALKLEEIKFADFIKQVLLLFGSILIFMIITAVAIFIIMKLAIG